MSGVPLDLEALRQVFADRRTHIAIAKVIETELASDKAVLFAKCEILLQERIVVAKVCWDAAGPNAGIFQFPQVDDLVLLEFPEGDNNQCFLTKRLSSKTDTIPPQAEEGHLAIRALAGKTAHLMSDTRINLGLGADDAPDEPLVLGNVLVSALTDLYGKIDELLTKLIAGPIAISGAPGNPAPTFPALIADLTAIQVAVASQKSQYLDTAASNIVSQLSFTERGGS